MSNYIWLVKNRHIIAHMVKKGGKSAVLVKSQRVMNL